MTIITLSYKQKIIGIEEVTFTTVPVLPTTIVDSIDTPVTIVSDGYGTSSQTSISLTKYTYKSDTTTPTDVLAVASTKYLLDGSISNDVASFSLNPVKTDTVLTTDTHNIAYGKTIVEANYGITYFLNDYVSTGGVNVIDTISIVANFFRSWQDISTGVDAFAINIQKPFTETTTTADNPTIAISAVKPETVVTSDAFNITTAFIRSWQDTPTFLDDRMVVFRKVSGDAIIASDGGYLTQQDYILTDFVLQQGSAPYLSNSQRTF